MRSIKCPSCGQVINVSEKSSGSKWAIGCAIAAAVGIVGIAVVGLLAAIAIPSFIKARNTSQGSMCINNLRQIDAAKEQWALSTKTPEGGEIDVAEVNKFLKGNTTPVCPAQGKYSYGEIGSDPECSVHGQLSQPKAYR